MKNKLLWIIGILFVVFSIGVYADCNYTSLELECWNNTGDVVFSIDLKSPMWNIPENAIITNFGLTTYVKDVPPCNWFERKLLAQDGNLIYTYWFNMGAKNNALLKKSFVNPCEPLVSFFNLNTPWIDGDGGVMITHLSSREDLSVQFRAFAL